MRDKILIVDDEELNRELLRQIFEKDYDIVMACDGHEAIEQFDRWKNKLAAVLLDIVMPVADGYQVLQVLNTQHETKVIPVIMITANSDINTALDCYSFGAAEIINKPFAAKIVKKRVYNMIEMYQSREHLEKRLAKSNRKLEEQAAQLEKFYNDLVDTISDIVEFRDMESGQHVKRVKGLTRILASTYRRLYPEDGLTLDKIDIIEQAAALHDIGKIAIPDSILLKPGRLTDEERKIMQTHTTKGCSILAKLENVQDNEHYQAAYEIVRYHHERYDGRGYPDGLVGDNIPLSAQLVALADVYDALTSKRVYKDAYGRDKAYRMIMDGECGVFGPKILNCMEKSKKAMELFSEATADKEE